MKRLALAFWLILVPLFAWFGRDGIRAQTRVSLNSQVSPLPSVVMLQYATCTGLPACSGLQYAQFRMSDGTTRTFWLVPTPPSFAVDTKWTSIPVTVPSSTSLTCSQVKP